MKWIIAKIKNLWYSLPHQVQATAVVFATTAGAVLGQAASKYYLDPAAQCWKWVCLRHTLSAALFAGVIAARACYMRPGPGPNGRQIVTNNPKAQDPA